MQPPRIPTTTTSHYTAGNNIPPYDAVSNLFFLYNFGFSKNTRPEVNTRLGIRTTRIILRLQLPHT